MKNWHSRLSWRQTGQITMATIHSLTHPLFILRSISRGEAMELLKRWFVEDKGTLNVNTILCCYSNHCHSPSPSPDILVAPRSGGGIVVGATGQLSFLSSEAEHGVHQEGTYYQTTTQVGRRHCHHSSTDNLLSVLLVQSNRQPSTGHSGGHRTYQPTALTPAEVTGMVNISMITLTPSSCYYCR